MEIKEIKKLLNEIKRVLNTQNEQKKRGLNDYNILTSILKQSDEVRLHSRFLYSMLDPNGAHYQDTLFLQYFMELALGHKEGSYSNYRVEKEADNIDLLITDGKKYFIIENKIYAPDQPRQIARYIKLVKNDYKALDKNIFVYYLSPNGKNPSRKSLGEFEIIKNQLVYKPEIISGKPDTDLDKSLKYSDKKGTIVAYKKISYRKEVISWINKCLEETENLTNINSAFLIYRDVIERVLHTRKDKVSTIENYLMNSPENLLLAREVAIEMPKIKGTMLFNYFNLMMEIDKLPSCQAIDNYEGRYVKRYSEKNCLNWFNSSKKDRKNIGVIFDIGSSDFDLCIMVASKVLHIGVIPKASYKLTTKGDEGLTLSSEFTLDKREWGTHLWYSLTPIPELSFDFKEKTINFLSYKKDSARKSPERELADNLIDQIITKYGK